MPRINYLSDFCSFCELNQENHSLEDDPLPLCFDVQKETTGFVHGLDGISIGQIKLFSQCTENSGMWILPLFQGLKNDSCLPFQFPWFRFPFDHTYDSIPDFSDETSEDDSFLLDRLLIL